MSGHVARLSMPLPVTALALSLASCGDLGLESPFPSDHGQISTRLLHSAPVAFPTYRGWAEGPSLVRNGPAELCDERIAAFRREAATYHPSVRCHAGALKGMFEIINLGLDPDSRTHAFVYAEDIGDTLEAEDWPLTHLIAERALFEVDVLGREFKAALAHAESLFAPMLLGTTNPTAVVWTSGPSAQNIAFPAAAGAVSTDAEKLTLIHEALARALNLEGPALNRDEVLRAIILSVGRGLRTTGEIQDVVLQDARGNDLTWSRELFRHELAQAVQDVAGAAGLGFSRTRARAWAEQVNAQQSTLFGFSRARPLPE